MRKLRLNKKIKYTLIAILILSISIKAFVTSINDLEKLSSKCDEKMGRLCTYYEIRNFKGE